MANIIIEKSNIRGLFSAPSIGNYGGDYSFAGCFLARAALDSTIVCDNLNPRSQQNGIIALTVIEKFGARVKRGGDSVNVISDKLRGCHCDISEFTQIAPMIALLAVFATGKTRISGFRDCPQLLEMITENLRAIGARCEIGTDDLWIWPQRSPEHAVLDAKNHAYMALALILISSYKKGATLVRNVDGLLKRYPEFLDTFSLLGGKYELTDDLIIS